MPEPATTSLVTPPAARQTDGGSLDIASYLLALEECFLAIRGRGVQWSRVDHDVAEAWLGAAIPLGTALRVIQARVRAWKYRHGDLARLPMALGYYSPSVLQAAKALGPLRAVAQLSTVPPPQLAPTLSAMSSGARTHHVNSVGSSSWDANQGERSIGAEATAAVVEHRSGLTTQSCAQGGESGGEFLLAELLDPLPMLVAQTRHLALQHAYRKAFEALDEAQRPAGGWEHDPLMLREAPDPQALLAKIRGQLRKLTVAGLTNAEAAALQTWLAPQLAGLALRMSRKAAAERTAALEEEWLADRLALLVPTLRGWLDPRDAS